MRILTFDIEDWFHILDHNATAFEGTWNGFEPRIVGNVDRILDLLDRKNLKATFFCLGWIARRHPGVLRNIAGHGHQIGSHSDLHQLVYRQSPEEFRKDLGRSMDELEQATGQKVRYYRAPGFSITAGIEWAFEILVDAGIEIDCSVFPAARAHGGLPDWPVDGPSVLETSAGQLKLLPINVARLFGRDVVFSGGGYFRLLPYSLLERLFARQPYVMTYFHPRDFDPNQPVLEGLSLLRRFKSYVGIGSALKKLEHLLEEFEFIDVAMARQCIDWEAQPHLSLKIAGGLSPVPAVE